MCVHNIDHPSLDGTLCELPDKNGCNVQQRISAGWKIKVFISSMCGPEHPRYNRVRQDLKKIIEDTHLAKVYLFEDEQASTISAGSHYLFALQDSDVCIFLIDNLDGVSPGVQAEVDHVKKHNIQALYYFCSEKSAIKTPLEQSLIGAQFAKSRTINKFEELCQNAAQGLIDDIAAIYHNYCLGRLQFENKSNCEEIQRMKLSALEQNLIPVIPKPILENVLRCQKYILNLAGAWFHEDFNQDRTNSNDIDEWCADFLAVLFEGKNIRQFNTSFFLEALKKYQSEDLFYITTERWNAIQYYFLGNIDKCLEHLKTALQLAKDSKQPSWIVSDVLIDLRNQQFNKMTMENCYQESDAQKELNSTQEDVYYPILDRLHESIYEKYIDSLFKHKIESPYTITLGSDLAQYGAMLASSYIVAMYNGSLTHILLLHDSMKRFLFYLCSRYDDWKFRLNLYKFSIFLGTADEIKKIENSYPEVLNNLTSQDAEDIFNFCSSSPIPFIRLKSQLRAFGAISLYLDDQAFQKDQDLIITQIKSWINDSNPIVNVGGNIFSGLSGAGCRISQDTLAEICIMFMDHGFSRWYMDMFRLMETSIDLRKMSPEKATQLLHYICNLIEDENDRNQINNAPNFLIVFRKQNKCLTAELDQKIHRYMPPHFLQQYNMELDEEITANTPTLIHEYLKKIQHDNSTQGKDGVYSSYAERKLITLHNLLISENYVCHDNALLDEVITVISNTLLFSKEDVSTKVDAITLLFTIVLKYPTCRSRNKVIFEKIYNFRDQIQIYDISLSNIEEISIQIGLRLLFIALGKDCYVEMVELLSCVDNSQATTITVEIMLNRFLHTTNSINFSDKTESVVLQKALTWIHSDNSNIRYYATNILLSLCSLPDNEALINRQLIQLIDSDNVAIKLLVLRNVYHILGIKNATRGYILSKCERDPNYIVRKVCLQIKEDHYNGSIANSSISPVG